MLAVSTEPSVIVSESNSDKIVSQVPQMLQETEVSSPNIKQNSVPPPQSKYLSVQFICLKLGCTFSP